MLTSQKSVFQPRKIRAMQGTSTSNFKLKRKKTATYYVFTKVKEIADS